MNMFGVNTGITGPRPRMSKSPVETVLPSADEIRGPLERLRQDIQPRAGRSVCNE
jgi:hypothetical protein